jgi:hypothetical protein
MKEDRVSSKGKFFAEYKVRYAGEGSGGRDKIEILNSNTVTQIYLM